MIYTAYEARRLFTAPVFALAGAQSAVLGHLPARWPSMPPVRTLRALSETTRAMQITHRRPPYGIDSVPVHDSEFAVTEEAVMATPFGSLLHFAKSGAGLQAPVLVIPGLAGHFGTLVRDTVRTLLGDHDVYLADWHNARDIPMAAGRFGLEEYIAHVIDFLSAIRPAAHVVAVCQPCAPVLAAAAIMAEDDSPGQPPSITLMAGPVDARVNPGPVKEFADRWPRELLERVALHEVPWPHRGAGRRVYPGFLQIMGFMGMNPRRHMTAIRAMFNDSARGRQEKAARTMAFYEEYFAVLDVTAEFYLETLEVIFTEHHLARGCMRWRGRTVDPSAIRTALLTVEAEKDQLCPPGQTYAAHALCTGIPSDRRRHHLQADVGHYGVFSGRRFQREIYPVIRDFIAEADEPAGLAATGGRA